MSQAPSPNTLNLEQAAKKLEEATTEFGIATEELELATKLRNALDRADLLKTKALEAVQEAAVKTAKEKQKEAAKKIAGAQKDVLTANDATPSDDSEAPNLTEIQKKAVEALTKLPPKPFDWKKMRPLLIGIGIAVLAIMALVFFSASGKATVIVGLAVAAIGQICESAKKADDVQANPRLKDGLELFGEAFKLLGVLAVLVGAVWNV